MQERIFGANIVCQLQGNEEILYTLDSILFVLKAALLARLSLLESQLKSCLCRIL